MTAQQPLAVVEHVDGLVRRVGRMLTRPITRAYNLVSSGLFQAADCEHESQTRVALILGGDYEREMAAIRLLTTDREKAMEHLPPSLATGAPIIVSSGAAGPEHLIDLGVPPGAVIFDRRAVCTVTNFTSLVGDLKGLGTREVCIFTSAEHLPRALRIGRLVLGAEGMAVRGFAVEHDRSAEHYGQAPPESVWRTTRDYVRALLWVVSDVDFGMAVPWLRPGRRPETQSELTRLADEKRRAGIDLNKGRVYEHGVQEQGGLEGVHDLAQE